MHKRDKREYDQSCMENGEPIVTPHLANFSHYSLIPTNYINTRKDKGKNGGHTNSSSDKFE